jgi:hypothetical protein
MEALILVATQGGLTMGPKDPQQKTRRREPAGPFGEQCSSADLDGTNPPAVPRQHALPHDVAAAVVTVVAVVVVVRIVVVIGVRPGADEEHPAVESVMETARCKAGAGSDRGYPHSAAVPAATVPATSAAVPGHAAAVPTSSTTTVPAASATAVETTASAKAASVTTAAASVAATTATTAS